MNFVMMWINSIRVGLEKISYVKSYIYIYIYIYKRWVQVTPGVTLKSYTFFKLLDLSKSNDKKNALICCYFDKDLIYYPYL